MTSTLSIILFVSGITLLLVVLTYTQFTMIRSWNRLANTMDHLPLAAKTTAGWPLERTTVPITRYGLGGVIKALQLRVLFHGPPKAVAPRTSWADFRRFQIIAMLDIALILAGALWIGHAPIALILLVFLIFLAQNSRWPKGSNQ
ncbi:MAG: hypothetical protein ACPGVA_00280 [Pikeienuella sp.]